MEARDLFVACSAQAHCFDHEGTRRRFQGMLQRVILLIRTFVRKAEICTKNTARISLSGAIGEYKLESTKRRVIFVP
jgi:hypothetical protein